jgi:hypothetical protein
MLSNVTGQFGVSGIQVPSNASGLLLASLGKTLECVATPALNIINHWHGLEEVQKNT